MVPDPREAVATALARALAAKDGATACHCDFVGALCEAVGRRLGLHAARIGALGLAGRLHDVGKIAIPDGILRKPGRLSPAEYSVMQRHALIGSEIMQIPGFADQALWIRHHHESVDGCGYPDALAGDAIPLESRIILVADAFEAMTADRPYRRGRSGAAALQELHANVGTQFDGGCVAALEDALCETTLWDGPQRRFVRP